MVLAVDVGGDGAAYGDHAGARGNRHEPAQGYQPLHQRLHAHTRSHRDDTGGQVHLVDGVQVGGVEHGTPGVLGGIPVAAPEPPGDDPSSSAGRRPGGIGHGQLDGVGMEGSDHLGGAGRGATPAGEHRVPSAGRGHRP